METNKLYCENCLDTMARMPDEFIDLTVTSPPYDSLRDYKGYSFDFEKIALELFRVTKKGGVLVWVVGDETKNGSESGTSFRQALKFMEIGFNLYDTMIYLKDSIPFPQEKRYNQIWEYMFVFSVGQPKTFNAIKRKNNASNIVKLISHRRKDGSLKREKIKYNNECNYGNVWQHGTGFGKSAKDEFVFKHPAIFPEQLAADHIYSWSNPGDLVWDPMTGSGTVPKMAIKLKRNWIGSEISAEYCEIAQKRINAEKQKIDLFKVA